MKTKKIMRAISFVLLFAMSVSGLSVVAEAAPAGEQVVANDYIQYSVNNDNGRFAISTAEGSPLRSEDDDQPLLYEDIVPDTSFTTFIIDGETYIYGNSYEFLGMGDNFETYPTTDGYVNESTWTIKGVQITQTLEIVEDAQSENSGNVKVSYDVINNSGADVEIGSRMLFDTMVGSNDGAPVIIAGQDGAISTERTLSGPDVPTYWKAVDSEDASQVVAYGILSGWSNIAPDEITVAHWQNLSSTKWGYTPDYTMDFTDEENEYEEADSAVALVWDPSVLASGEERVYETYYGVGEVSSDTSNANFTARSYGPDKLTLNDRLTGYTEGIFEVGLQIDNTYTNSQTLRNVTATIELGYGLKLAEGETAEKTYSSIGISEVKNIAFELSAIKLQKTAVPYYRITVIMDNLSEPLEKVGLVLIPAITGEAPEITYTAFSPGTLYNGDNEKYITITGSGFDLLRQVVDNEVDYLFDVIITNTATNESTVIPSDYIEAGSDSIIVYIPNSLEEICEVGAYAVSIEYSYQQISKTFDFSGTLVMSDEQRYQVNKYGILQVVRTESGGNYIYSIEASEDENTAASEDNGGTVMLSFRGNIEEYDGAFTINDSVTSINSTVEFLYDPDEMLYAPSPITIKKCGHDYAHSFDYISITGSGTMMLGDFPFSIGGFAIELEDRTMYTVDPDDDDESDGQPIEVVPTFLGFSIPDINGLPITVKRAVLGADFVSFGGALDFGAFLTSLTGLNSKSGSGSPSGSGGSSNPGGSSDPGSSSGSEEDDDDGAIKAAVTVDEIRFGVSGDKIVFKGINASGEIGIDKEVVGAIIPGVDIGAEVEVKYNSFDNNCIYMAADVDFFIIYASAVLQFKEGKIGNIKLMLPDKDNSRKYMEIFEATGVENGRLQGRMLYRFVISATERDGRGRVVKVHGSHQRVGTISPELFCRLRDNGAPEAELYRMFPDARPEVIKK